MLKIQELILRDPDWRATLSNSPYNIRVRDSEQFPELSIFSYSMIKSDFSFDEVREARGLILSIDEDRSSQVVCMAFTKFFNADETLAAKIDPSTARVFDKVDGSLIRVYHYKDQLFFATNNGFNCEAALPENMPLNNKSLNFKTFQDLVDRALKNADCPKSAFTQDKWTLMFELTSRANRVVVDYGDEPKLTLLGARNNVTLVEISAQAAQVSWGLPFDIPTQYDIRTIEECKEAAKHLSTSFEGYVVQDNYFNRVKVKGAAFLDAFHLKSNDGTISYAAVFKCIQDETIDDVIKMFPEYTDTINELIGRYRELFDALRKMMRYAFHVYTDPLLRRLDEKSKKREFAKTILDNSMKLHCYSKLFFDAYKLSDFNDNVIDAYMKSFDYDEFERKYVELFV
jgi:T4 RnlA family RNA ligase